MRIQLGLKETCKQFALLDVINAFVGGIVGLERSVLPRIAEIEFYIAAKTAILSFIIVFGIVKPITNYYTGALANRFVPKEPAGDWLDDWHSRSIHFNVCSFMELDYRRQCTFRNQVCKTNDAVKIWNWKFNKHIQQEEPGTKEVV